MTEDFVPDWLDQTPMTLEEAAAECGLTLDEFFRHLVADGLLIQHADGTYEPVDHQDLVLREDPPSPFDR